MAQLVTRIDDDLADEIDGLISRGLVESRSDAVRQGLRALIDHHRRSATAAAIVGGYTRFPQSEDEMGWADDATRAMIAEEPW